MNSQRTTRVAAICLLVVLLPSMRGEKNSDEPLPAVKQFMDEMWRGLRERKLEEAFKGSEEFFADRLDASSGGRTFKDKTDLCRLAWVDQLLRHPIEAIGKGDVFTRQLHEASLPAITDIAFEKLAPLGKLTPAMNQDLRQMETPLEQVVSAIEQADAAARATLAPLTDAERAELRAEIYKQTTDCKNGHRAPSKEKALRVYTLLTKMDMQPIHRAARSLAALADPKLLEALSHIPAQQVQPIQGVKGSITAVIETKAGKIIVGGTEANEYALDEMDGVCGVIDPGGNDTYIEGSVGDKRPALVILDLAGNDTYRGEKPGIQGGAILGLSLLVDVAGDDVYEAHDVAQGSCVGGAGILVDMAGNDKYRAYRRVQGQGVAGIGILADVAGNDDYRAAMLGQGVGGPLGFGLLADQAGADHYYAGGLYPGPYDDSPGYAGFSQGVGVGRRGTANGGIGVLLDGGGDDVYEADYFSTAGAYWFAAGFLRDFGGNDQRVGSTRTAFDGLERKVGRFLRYGCGFGCHYGVGMMFDDEGDDSTFADFGGVGFAWDMSVAVIWDGKGNDHYDSPGHGVAGAYNNGFSAVLDGGGSDVYAGAPPAMAEAQSEYHREHPTAKSFTFLMDWQGADQYPDKLENSHSYERGWAGGFFMDR